jgi:drug/metabolite transporter (DMT)-like permease
MTTSGRWKLGLFLAAITALLWGILPIVLKALLSEMSPITITWYRFLMAAILLGGYMAQRRRIPSLRVLNRRGWILLSVAIVGVCANYLLYLLGLERVSPGTAQMVIQLAPMFLLLGGLVFFREEFGKAQWVGLGLLTIGLVLFFGDRLEPVSGGYLAGVLIIILAAVLWAAYALAQKQLLNRFSSDQILLLIYLAAAVLFLAPAEIDQVFDLSAFNVAFLLFASLNTVIAYGAFAEALALWEASRVSAVLSTTPLLTLAFMWLLGRFWPDFAVQEVITAWKIIGALLVVCGSGLAALARPPQKKAKEVPLASIE